MVLSVRSDGGVWLPAGPWGDVPAANRFLAYLVAWAFAAATVRAYAYDVLCFARFCVERDLRLVDVVAADLFDWIAWQGEVAGPRRATWWRLRRTPAPPRHDQPSGGPGAGVVRASGQGRRPDR